MSDNDETAEAAEMLKNAGEMPEEDAAEVASAAESQFRLSGPDESSFPVDLRALIRQRTETKMRRIHKQWFCFDPGIQAEEAAALADLAELTGREIQKQAVQKQTSRKYALPTPIRAAQERYDQAKALSRQVGAMGVFQNLTADELTAARKVEGVFEKAKVVLLAAFVRWETADGVPIPADVLGRDDLDVLMEPEVLEQGEWLPLATIIVNESASVIDRPTSPTP